MKLGDALLAVDRGTFRDAMALLGAAVNVVTTDGPAGPAGLTVSAVCSVTDAPATLLVCLNRGGSQADVFRRNGVLCVNTLAGGSVEVSNRFAGSAKLGAGDRFGGGDWSRLATGSPVLDSALVACDCTIIDIIEKGTHSVFFAEVQAIRRGPEQRALIYWMRRYHQLACAAG